MLLPLRLLAALIALAPLFPPSYAERQKEERKEGALERYHRKRPKPKSSGPCKVINNACIHAGFVDDGPAGKDVRKDCREPLLLGQSVKGVHLIPGIIASCKQNKESEAARE